MCFSVWLRTKRTEKFAVRWSSCSERWAPWTHTLTAYLSLPSHLLLAYSSQSQFFESDTSTKSALKQDDARTIAFVDVEFAVFSSLVRELIFVIAWVFCNSSDHFHHPHHSRYFSFKLSSNGVAYVIYYSRIEYKHKVRCPAGLTRPGAILEIMRVYCKDNDKLTTRYLKKVFTATFFCQTTRVDC